MVARLTVIFIIFLSLEVGITLTLLPWISFGILGDWGNNYLLAYVADKTGLPILQTAVASGWVRGAVTGLGILNIFIAFWEIAHFNQSVKMLEGKQQK
jgi:ABC-type transport system involved in multi-copper enzyme maturation permease subunit